MNLSSIVVKEKKKCKPQKTTYSIISFLESSKPKLNSIVFRQILIQMFVNNKNEIQDKESKGRRSTEGKV